MKYWDHTTIDKIRKGYFSAVYFNRTQKILLQENNLTPVTMQIFQKQYETIIAGIEPVKELLQEASGYFDNDKWIDKSNEIEIESLKDGEKTDSWDTVLLIRGPYAYFAHLESVYLGILARCSKIATNTKKVTIAAVKKPVIFFADRFDYFLNQELDGYSAKIGGISGVATSAQAFLIGENPVGTIPHALIAVNNGSTVLATEAFVKNFPDIPLIVLVDFENDCVKTSLEIAKKFGKKLYGVRLDTSEMLIDKSIQSSVLSSQFSELSQPVNQLTGRLKTEKPASENRKQETDNRHGVSPQLVKDVRKALDQNGFQYVKIVVSGGFNEEKIKKFEKEKVAVDIYGVGSSLMKGNIDFTADIVKVNGKNIAKQGRKFISIK